MGLGLDVEWDEATVSTDVVVSDIVVEVASVAIVDVSCMEEESLIL